MQHTVDHAPPRRLRVALLIVGAIVVFAAHFRPWEVGFLEEWALGEFWIEHGPAGFIENFAGWSLSRPLHLVPTAIGLALTGGMPQGIFFVMGVVAVLQYLGVMWALRTARSSFVVTFAVAVFAGLHPLWPGGFLQRFLPAQTAALAVILLFGFVIRWLQQGRARWLVGAGAAVILGLAVYPGPAAAAPLAAGVISLAMSATWRRRVAAVATVTGAAAVMTAYSLLVSRLVGSESGAYESVNFAAGASVGPAQFLRIVASLLVNEGQVLLVGILAVAVLGSVLALTGAIDHRAGWLMTGTAVLSPLCAAVYFGNSAWLADIERVAYATSLGLLATLLIWPLSTRGHRVRLEAIIAIALIAVSVVGAVRGIQKWQPFVATQHELLAQLAPAVAQASGDQIVVVIDHSGTYGWEATLPQYYLSAASHIMNGDPTEVWLCYQPGDPVLPGAALCDPAQTGDALRPVGSFQRPGGLVEIFIGEPR